MPLTEPPLPPFPWVDIPIIIALVALNGLFAMSELAIVSARKPRLQAMASAGHRGAAAALALTASPGRFLSTIQIGITLISLIAGAFSGATLSEPTALRLAGLGLGPETARTAAYVLVIGLTTFAAIIIGELVPKQFALRRPEPIAVIAALPMLWISRATAPLGSPGTALSSTSAYALGMRADTRRAIAANGSCSSSSAWRKMSITVSYMVAASSMCLQPRNRTVMTRSRMKMPVSTSPATSIPRCSPTDCRS